jgi:hypothetical protein
VQHIQSGARGLSLFLDLHRDRMAFVGAIALALMAGAFIGAP